jgi:hypothetical protein
LKRDTIYNFVWVVGDFGLSNTMRFDEYGRSFADEDGVSTGNSLLGNGQQGGGSISSATFPTGFVNGQRGPLTDTRIYESVGAWVCTGVIELQSRDVWDYGTAKKIRNFVRYR